MTSSQRLQEADDVVDVAVLVVQHQRGVLSHVGQRGRRLRDRLGAFAVEAQPEVGVDLGGPAAPVRPDRGVQREIGQPLGHQALRGVDQKDRLLGVTFAVDEPGLLAAVLGVVAGVGLVRDQPRAGWTSAA